MVGVGEVTGKLPEVFDRLSILAQRRYNFRKTLVSALVYPAIVGALSFTVVSVLLGFVVPRFRELFLGLNAELPTSTRILLACSDGFVTYWPVLLAITAGLGVAGFVMIRNEPCRRRAGTAMLNMPFVGVLLARLIFATILQVWAAMLQSRVPLLDALEKSKDAVRNAAFLELIDNVQAAVSSGGRVGETLAGSPFVDPMLAAAITTGEDNGHLAEAVEFSSVCADDDNTQLITTLTRIAEPVFIALLGLMVGTVAMSLFLPMFDIAGAARH
jgi:type II secretory pathway component PulF